jgi:ABC-type antimicrobial peptide transport system permease subunit
MGEKEINRINFQNILDRLGVIIPDEGIKTAIRTHSTETDAKGEKEVRIVGVYFGVDIHSYTASNVYKPMMNTTLMEALNVYSGQGDYSKLLFSKRAIDKGSDVIVDGFLQKQGLTLNWYNNSVLEIILTNQTMIRQVADLFLYAALALSVFSIFMLYNYISASIASKKQSVGVLRALGAGGKDILLTFLTESIIVAVINGILANIFAVLGCAFVNTYIVEIMNISVHFALFGVRQMLIISAVSLLTAIISSTSPIWKISKKKPIELIRRP